jgi:hypothetical protein
MQYEDVSSFDSIQPSCFDVLPCDERFMLGQLLWMPDIAVCAIDQPICVRLEQRGLARRTSSGRWAITAAGRAQAEPGRAMESGKSYA